MKYLGQQRRVLFIVMWLLSITITGCLVSKSGDDVLSFKDSNRRLKKSDFSTMEEIAGTSKGKTLPNSNDSELTERDQETHDEDAIFSKRAQNRKDAITQKLPVYGYVENVLLGPMELKLKAKLDSGARVSSLGASNLIEFERDGEKWIRFHIVDPSTQEKLKFEKKIERYSRIKQHLGHSQKRPVVLLDVKLGNHHVQREFNLVNREKFIYKILLGRNVLSGIALIDTSKTFQVMTQTSHQKE